LISVPDALPPPLLPVPGSGRSSLFLHEANNIAPKQNIAVNFFIFYFKILLKQKWRSYVNSALSNG
jgi:hypothetical protein